MRPIKFRAWDEDAKVMSRCQDFLPMAMDLLDAASVYRRHIQLMQFTGLTDKNGCEIYEGDIIEWESRVTTGILPWGTQRKSRYRIEWAKYCDPGWSAVLIWKDYGGSVAEPSEIRDYKHVEVIGNIYENPELLK